MKNLSKLSIVVFLISFAFYANEIKLPKNPLNGRIEFENKGCINCHAISGYGGREGPDLSTKKYYGSFMELAALIWNHIPDMDKMYRQNKIDRPRFTQEEMLDLVGFIYYLRYLGEPGSVSNGKKLLRTKKCLSCHKMGGIGGDEGPSFDDLRQYASPMYIVQAMWNHGPAMQESMRKKGMQYPNLSGQDIVDITYYFRQSSMGETEIRMSPGNPSKGKKLFRTKKCINCHSVEGENGKKGPDFSKMDLRKSVTEIAGFMWNHSPIMMDYMKEKSIEWPVFDGMEMADLIAYLYFLGFEDDPGDPGLGESVFEEKGCAGCHQQGGKGAGPDLANIKRFASPIKMLQLMWNHAPKMEDMLLIQNEEWPKLTAKEMQNLYSFLKKVIKKK